MAEFIEDSPGLESTTVGIYRTSTTVKGGRRFSFGALVVVGDRAGTVGIGYGKAPGVPAAIEKAQKAARKEMHRISVHAGTLPHSVTASYGASSIKLVPASPGTGVIAGGTLRAILEMAGVRDCLTKAIGSTNQKNLAKAAMLGLQAMRTKASIAELRGVEIESSVVERKLELGARYAPASTGPKVAAPTGQKDDRNSRGGGKRGGGRPQQNRGGGKPQQNRGGGGKGRDAGAPPAGDAPTA
jgi:small subunit ribosomal protein S5